MTMLKTALILLFSACFFSCSKDNNTTADFSGKYHGQTNQKITTNGQVVTQQPYDMVVDVAKGDNDGEIKILFGNWLTKATLNGNKFTIQETSFTTESIVTTGDGEFSGDKMTINYIQKIANITTAEYSGTLTKF